ncbi:MULTISPECIES: amidohydrolase [unclassified Brevundimonas]|uniref:amidohydrolase family protein n=1 Tax=unclassified Brevundimonas TaxID=2622653 RepID=UPI000CFBBCFC|nr:MULTISPECIES: amidohydrolase family protein [unclassified Brevundimonas]PRA27381.1 amidohydrolase [Brevundimonas sp. MYb27]PQZ84533.1 amidohydrolase [Brevundimonas sp. MYb31]PRB17768.1 amidohydrolase [Brevundimonas sp. MYb52]PRB38139.1 amidohydrolase [Brevundimonas sp. MYb46]PRB56079.1 amidohydrolase [Brevundimonas sp. MYb33]
MGGDLRIVDPHVHLWDLSRARYGWLQDHPLPNNPAGDMSPIAHRDYLLKDYLADTTNWRVDKIVHVEAGQPIGQQLAETDWLQAMADSGAQPHAGQPQGIVAGVDLQDPDLDAHLEAHAARPNVRGVRQIVCWHEDPLKTYTDRDRLRDPAWVAGLGKLARRRLSFDLQLYPSQMATAAIVASRLPDVPMIVNHAGLPTDRDEAGMARWRTGLRLLAAQPQVSIKISGLGITDRAWTPDSLRPIVLECIDAFGIDRAMFASDFPVERVHGTFDAFYSAFDAITADFSADERDRLFAANAEAIYRI